MFFLRGARNFRVIAKCLLLCFFTVLLLAVISGNSAFASEERGKSGALRILFIGSFSPSDGSARRQLRGTENVFGSTAIIDIEFLYSDAQTGSSLSMLRDTLQYRIEQNNIKYDAVIASGDIALETAVTGLNDLLHETPVFFEDVYDRELAERAASEPHVYGKVQELHFSETVDSALNLFPDTDSICFIYDNSPTSLGQLKQFRDFAEKRGDLTFFELNTSMLIESELRAELSELNDNCILLCGRIDELEDKQISSDIEACKLVTESAAVPVFCLADLNIGDGFFGGAVVSPEKIGERTAKAIESFLDNGELPDDYFDTESEFEYKYDYNIIKQLGINLTAFPADTQYVNYEESFREKYGGTLALISVIVMLGLVFIQLVLRWFEFRIQNRKLSKTAENLQEALNISETNTVAKSEYLGSVANEIREPINRLFSLVERTKKEIDNKESTINNIGDIENTVRAVYSSFKEFLSISNTDSDFMEIKSEKISIINIFDDLSDMYSKLCSERDITFETEKKNIVSNEVKGDSYKLRLLLSNILSNALKYTENGMSVKFSVAETESNEQGVALFIFKVSDSGIGMSSEKLKVIFGSDAEDSTGSGLGIGLAMTKRYVSMMSGEIDAESSEGAGTSVTVRLPFKMCSEEDPVVYRPPESYDFQGNTALVAENNELNLAILKDMLEMAGFKAVCVKNGREAVYAFNGAGPNDFDIILLDSQMPIMDGAEAANTIRKSMHSNSASIPIIVAVYDAYPHEIERLKKSGVDDFVKKPVSAEQLLSVISKYVDENEL